MRPGNCSGSYSEPPRAREIALRSSSCPREVDATTFSIRYLAMGPPLRAGVTQTGALGGQRDRGGALYGSVRPRDLSGGARSDAGRGQDPLFDHRTRAQRMISTSTVPSQRLAVSIPGPPSAEAVPGAPARETS